MKTFFCLTQEHVPSGEWTQDLITGKPVEVPAGGGRCLTVNWVYQTWALLISSGIPCYAILGTPAAEGTVIALSIAASRLLKMPDAPFFVDIVADDIPHPAAHLHIVQNKAYARRIPNALFMPHWCQPGLIPRKDQRGDRFENLCFYGHSKNLTHELQTPLWRQRLKKELGIELHIPSVNQWHDYSETDAVVAIRDFSYSPHWNKPGTKLYNAWLAGVPFIGGRDSAYAADGRPGIDYLVATSPQQVFNHLRRLKEDPTFRAQLVQQGSYASKEFTRSATLERWKKLVTLTIPELALQWEHKTKRKRFFFAHKQQLCLTLERHSWSHLFQQPTPTPLEINFSLPEETFPSYEWVKAWDEGAFVPMVENGKCITSYSWIYQTWSLLHHAGFSFNLLKEVPPAGIAIFLSMSMPKFRHLLKSQLFLVDVVAHSRPHPTAHIHLVHNKAHARWLPRSFFIPHWPQPYLIPRDSNRGTRFEHICFLGDSNQLATEFLSPAWKKRLKEELQLEFSIKDTAEWHDYSDVDAVIALRSMSRARYFNKPATKLYNAWLAGVPFIGGHDSAYAADGRPGVDYLVASSEEETFQHLRRLKEDVAFRQELVFQGSEAGKGFSREATLLRWQTFLLKKLPKLVEKWQKKSLLERYLYVVSQRFFCFLDSLFH